MKPRVSELLKDAQQLDHRDLADLVHELLRVLDVPETSDRAPADTSVEGAWKSEALARLAEIDDGSVESVDGRGSLDAAREQLAARRG